MTPGGLRVTPGRLVPWLWPCLLLCLWLGGAGCRRHGRSGGARADSGADAGRGARLAAGLGKDPGGIRLAERNEPSEDDPQALSLPACRAVIPPSAAPSEAILHVHLAADPPHLDPFDDSSEITAQVLTPLIYEPLLRCGGGGADDGPGPAVAARWQVGPAGDAITLQLRPRAIFHDGRPITSWDVRASLEAVWRGGAHMPQARAALADLAAIDVVGPDTVRLRLKRPAPILLRALCDVPIAPAGPPPGGRRGAAARDPVGSGPFRFAGWSKGKRVRLVRFAQPGLPLAPLAEIVFEIEGDTGRALGRLRRGELELLPQLHAVHYPDQVRPAALGSGLRLYEMAGQRYSFLALNHHHPPLGELAFRQALSLSWDRAALGDELHAGLVTPIAAPPFADLPAPPFDPAKAAQLLRAGGLLPSEAPGPRRVMPVRFRLQLLHSGGRNAKAELRRFADQLRRIGVLLELTAVDPTQMGERLRAGQFDLALVSWQGPAHEDPRVRFAALSPFNYGGYRSPRLEALLDEIRVADGATTRPALDQRLAVMLEEDLPAVFLYRHSELLLASARVRGLCNQGGRVIFSQASLVPAEGR